ncbi:MAG TPA: DNA-directed RNA polymerase subunit beta' [Armatimonadota bacterium]|nr:DNA-directed RNA polymerase subunit beta' [Armatimonadota bacterium]HPO71744.1 DNA-directed RNA polymerase subunit beta' [Armatimonadota bacterium]HPT96329.1 DNA-directed RNA polymerase subunit beta' [Armatimonadota bacterium]
MANGANFDKIRIGIASPEEIRSWSSGEVKKPETINYRTFKPERDGLFCERIFGPVKDWECHCGRYKKIKFKGIICDRCGVEVTRAKVRRERMGHIELAAPVSHTWYLKGVPSPMSLILDVAPRPLEKVLYFVSYIVTHMDRAFLQDHWDAIKEAVSDQIREEEAARDEHIAALKAQLEEELADEELTDEERAQKRSLQLDRERLEQRNAEDKAKELTEGLQLLQDKDEKQLITEAEYRVMRRVLDVATERTGIDFTKAFRAGMGAAAIKELLEKINLEELSRQLRKETEESQGAKKLRAIKRLEVVRAFLRSKSRPEWMILEVVPVIPPELRPIVQLDGGRFATSDLNDLYRRIINRNNRLKKITQIRAPESIINHEKRLLQEAVDALIDNGRRQRPVTGSNNRPLKSLSDMLKGKEGRFRKNLLGKRVDYSGRSVIVVGPELKLHQCGIPKEMALELFKPFVMKMLVEKGYTSNIKTAKRMIDRMREEVWDALEEVIREHPVMLNRAPTLHRLGIQAFEPVLVDGKAIKVHPLVCHAFNADFDGDQMAAHVPLSATAQAEARVLMLSTNNLFSPADGRPIVAPVQDIVLGCYYLTVTRDAPLKEDVVYRPAEAMLAYEVGELDLHQLIRVRVPVTEREGTAEGNGEVAERQETQEIETTVGRLIFNNILPEDMRYRAEFNRDLDKGAIARVVARCYEMHGSEATVKLLDDLKDLGFRFATRAGVSIASRDMNIQAGREEIIRRTEQQVASINQQYQDGFLTANEREENVLKYWTDAGEEIVNAILHKIDRFNPIYMMANSKARGSVKQISQLAGMRGLMADPFGRIIDSLPIKSNFHEGLNVLEYFISTHGARKGLADTALRTADAGYLTRRLVDVAQDVIIRAVDCGTHDGIHVSRLLNEDDEEILSLRDRIRGRTAASTIFIQPDGTFVQIPPEGINRADGETGEVLEQEQEPDLPVLVPRGEEISDAVAAKIEESGMKSVHIRSPLTCELRYGICARCYGRDMATGRLAEVGLAAGIVAAQSIGEPGTQLTMRTFHTGGVAAEYLTGVAEVKKKKQEALRELHEDIRRGIIRFDVTGAEETGDTSAFDMSVGERERVRQVQELLKVLEEQVKGLLRVVELFEARKPKGQAIITDIDGLVADIETHRLRQVIVHADLPIDGPDKVVGEYAAKEIIDDETGEVLLRKGGEVTERVLRRLRELGKSTITVRRPHLVPYRGKLEVQVGDHIRAGDRLTEGPLHPQDILKLQGIEGVQAYLVAEIQQVYKSQGVDINDKHVEVIVRQMLKKRKVLDPGDTDLLPGQVVDKFELQAENVRVERLGGRPARAEYLLLGITEASLATESFLSAASFQKTTKVLTDAAVKGKEDHLVGLKENVIIGRLIPAGTGMVPYRELRVTPTDGDVSAFERLLPADEDLASETYTAARAVSILGEREERSSAAIHFPDVTAGTFEEVTEEGSLGAELGSFEVSAPEATEEETDEDSE